MKIPSIRTISEVAITPRPRFSNYIPGVPPPSLVLVLAIEKRAVQTVLRHVPCTCRAFKDEHGNEYETKAH